MVPGGMWRRELLEVRRTVPAQARAALVPLALALPALSVGLPAFHMAAVFASIAVFFAAIRAGRRWVMLRDSGILSRINAAPRDPRFTFVQFMVVRATHDFLLLLPMMTLLLWRNRSTPSEAVAVLGLAALAILFAEWVGVLAGSLAPSQGEVVPHCLVMLLVLLFASGAFSAAPSPRAWREVLATTIPFAYFHRGLRELMDLGVGWSAAQLFRGAALSSLGWAIAAVLVFHRWIFRVRHPLNSR